MELQFREGKIMHRSRLAAIVIDCLPEHFEESVIFWAAALGVRKPRRPGKNQRYVQLKRPESELDVLLQRVDRAPGIHLDIETDSVNREVARLEGAGARRKRKVKSWWVMRAPSGHAFCVVRNQGKGLLERSPPWQESEAGRKP
jgi:hypothetical protein